MLKQSILVATVVIVGLGASMAVHADQRQRAEKVSKNTTVAGDKEITTFSGIAYTVDESGYINVAGVLGFSTHPDGTLAVQVKAGGDFDRDAVLRLPVRLFDVEDGTLSVGVEYVREMRGQVEFGVRNLSLKDNGAIRSAALANGCEGVQLSNGQFVCINTTCGGDCKIKDVNGVKSCPKCTGGGSPQ